MSTDSQQTAPFVLPPNPQDAQITLTITVEEVPGEGLLMSAVLDPGGRLLDHDTVKQLFDEATSDLVAGEYVFEASNRGELLIKSPSAVSQDDGTKLVLRILRHLMIWRGQLVSALESFPSAQTIDAIARDVVGLLTIASLKRLAFTDEPVADARETQVVGVGCASCGFGLAFGIQNFLHALLGAEYPSRNEDVRELEGVRFLVEQEDEPVVKIGYLHQENTFAPCLNDKLAQRVHDAIAQVADEIVLEIAARNEVHRRLCAGSGLSLHRTYGFDSERLSRRVLELEAEAREAFAGVESTGDDEDAASVDPDSSEYGINEQPD